MLNSNDAKICSSHCTQEPACWFIVRVRTASRLRTAAKGGGRPRRQGNPCVHADQQHTCRRQVNISISIPSSIDLPCLVEPGGMPHIGCHLRLSTLSVGEASKHKARPRLHVTRNFQLLLAIRFDCTFLLLEPMQTSCRNRHECTRQRIGHASEAVASNHVLVATRGQKAETRGNAHP